MCWKRCKKVCSGRCGKVLWGVGKDEERCGEVWESVFGWGGGEEKCGEGVAKCVGMLGRLWEVWGCVKVLGKVWENVLGCGRDVGVRKSVEEV